MIAIAVQGGVGAVCQTFNEPMVHRLLRSGLPRLALTYWLNIISGPHAFYLREPVCSGSGTFLSR